MHKVESMNAGVESRLRSPAAQELHPGLPLLQRACACGGTATATTTPSTGSGAASATPAGDITVCPDFFRLSTLYDRVVEMYSGLALHMPGTTEGPARSYARLAYNYKTEYWGVR
jgi:hypothetical protein